MLITQIRNATVMIEFGPRRLLVDPMLSPSGVLPGFKLFGGGRRKNPLVELPAGGREVMETATDVLITHEHPDHLDKPAVDWIQSKGLPVWASAVDAPNLKRKGLDARALPHDDFGSSVEVIPGRHGHGLLGWLMGPVAGFYIQHEDEPGVYVTGDTVLTDGVRGAIERLKPDVVIAPAGAANFGIGKDLLFSHDELIELAQQTQGRLVFNHLEAIDHCPITRVKLHEIMTDAALDERVLIPADGEQIRVERSSESIAVGPSPSLQPGFQNGSRRNLQGPDHELVANHRCICCGVSQLRRAGTAMPPSDRPNVIIIFTDDQGYSDLGCYGSKKIKTPHLDRMASEGLRLTSFYAQPVCGVSRAALMTGSYPIRVAEPGNRKRLHTVPILESGRWRRCCARAGYATALIGKWHLCLRDAITPAGSIPPRCRTHRASTTSTGRYVQWLHDVRRRHRLSQPYFAATARSVTKAVQSWDSITSDYTAEALNWIEQHRDKPSSCTCPQHAACSRRRRRRTSRDGRVWPLWRYDRGD